MVEGNRLRVIQFVTGSARSGYFRWLAQRIDRSLFDLEVGSLAGYGPLHRDMEALGIPSFWLGGGRKAQYPLALLKLFWRLRHEGPHILHTHLFDASLVGMLAGRAAGGVLCVIHRHYSNLVHLYGKSLPKAADRMSHRLAHRIIACSQRTADFMVREEEVDPAKIAVVRLGFDFQELTNSGRTDVAELRKDFGIPAENRVISVIGRLDPFKGHSVLFEAVQKITPQVRQLTVLVVGDGPHRGVLEDQARRRGITTHVRFTGYCEEIAEVLRVSDIMVLPTLTEGGFNQVVLEAMGMGVPVITTPCAVEVAEHRRHCLVVPERDPGRLAQAITELVSDGALAAALRRNGQELAGRFTVERMVRSLEGLYSRWWCAYCGVGSRPGEETLV